MSAPALEAPRPTHGAWLKRIGAAGFAFFLAKGMVWLVLGATLWQYGS